MVGVRQFIEIGNEVWRGERHRGYPVNRLAMVGPVALAAWGETAEQRRKSRVELWNELGHIALGLVYPECLDRVVAVCCTDPELRKKLASNAAYLDGQWSAWIENLEKEPISCLYDVSKLKEIGNNWPKPQTVWLQGGTFTKSQHPIIKAGLSLRIHLPYDQVSLTHVSLDGFDIETYYVYHNPGTIIEIPIPPGLAKPLHIVRVHYESTQDRKMGFKPEDWNFKGDRSDE